MSNRCNRGQLFPERREQRRKEAQARALERAKRSPQEQLAKLDEGGHTATRERTRLEAQMARPKAARVAAGKVS